MTDWDTILFMVAIILVEAVIIYGIVTYFTKNEP